MTLSSREHAGSLPEASALNCSCSYHLQTRQWGCSEHACLLQRNGKQKLMEENESSSSSIALGDRSLLVLPPCSKWFQVNPVERWQCNKPPCSDKTFLGITESLGGRKELAVRPCNIALLGAASVAPPHSYNEIQTSYQAYKAPPDPHTIVSELDML